MLPAPIPWYRTRLFWGAMFVAMATFVGYTFYSFISGASSFSALTAEQILSYIILASSAGPVGLYGFKIFGSLGSQVSIVVYSLIMAWLTYKTFTRARVNIFYPLIFVVLFVLGSLGEIVFVSAL